jgi:hypothetical protein
MKKKILFALFIFTIVMSSCVTHRTLYINQLTVGMTVAQVEATYGPPRRVLESKRMADGHLYATEYRNYNGDVYALEFWDDYLVGYEYLYEERYVAPVAPPAYRPVYGTKVVVIRQSNNRPSQRPPQNVRPPANNNRPNNRPNNNNNNNSRPNQSTRPTEQTRPSGGSTNPSRTRGDASSSDNGGATNNTNTTGNETRTGRTR